MKYMYLVADLVKKFAASYRSRNSFDVFTNSPLGPYSESYKSSLQSHTAVLRLIFILPFHVRSFEWPILFRLSNILYAYFLLI